MPNKESRESWLNVCEDISDLVTRIIALNQKHTLTKSAQDAINELANVWEKITILRIFLECVFPLNVNDDELLGDTGPGLFMVNNFASEYQILI